MKCQHFLYALAVLALSILSCVSPAWVVPTVTVIPTHTETPVPTLRAVPVDTAEWTATVSQVKVNVRNEPDGDTVVGYLESGDEVTILRCVGDWCKISKPIAGWVFKGCLSIKSDLGCTARE